MTTSDPGAAAGGTVQTSVEIPEWGGADLFARRTVFVTPLPETDPKAAERSRDAVFKLAA